MLGQNAGRAIKKRYAFGLTVGLALAPLKTSVGPTEFTREHGDLGLDSAFASDALERAPTLTDGELSHPRLGQLDLNGLTDGWREAGQAVPGDRLTEAGRRVFDITFSLAALLLSLPVLLLVAALVKCDSRGPALYRQQRVGLQGKQFTLLKFRSMRVDAEALGPRWAAESDPRVTRVGRFLRLSRLDELPQLLNVLVGHMAVIGPRPERPYFAELLAQSIPHFDARLAVKPGITGWAQVNYPYGASIQDAREKLAYDLYYLKHRSMPLDVKIMLQTVRVILCREGSR